VGELGKLGKHFISYYAWSYTTTHKVFEQHIDLADTLEGIFT